LPAGHVAMLLNAELGFPYVVSVHGLDVFSTGQMNGRVGRWCRRISRLVYQRSKRVLCVSEAVRERVLEGMPAACRTSVVYNGVDAELFSPGSVAASQKTTVLSVGNLLPSKGHEVLIRAIGDIAPEFPNLALEIIGEGPELAHLQQVIQDLNLTQQVTFLGRRSRREVADAMRRCVLFALPSSYEGLGCVYLEAMSTAKPAVGCRGQGIAEIIRHGENGFLVGAGNVKELSLLLAMMFRDPQGRNNVGAAARDTILDRFTLAQQAEHLARIYRECAG
jgi:glycosyltransferase involved in cell wall biosynthesis